TLCLSHGDDYKSSTPYLNRIKYVNELFDEGHTIIILTARGSVSGLDLEELTRDQLHAWGVRYHVLKLGKPYADFYIDDKAVKDTDFFRQGF
ncbi:hypothetical protein N9N06_03660, partial [Aquiluna sp.]|nr:hypothetical protein [Aquiluna sp.]